MVIVFIRMIVRPEKQKELSQTLQSIIEKVGKERECLQAGFYQDVESETDFLVVEEWGTQKDWDDHRQSDIFKVLMGTGCLMRRPPEIMIHTVSTSSELGA